MHFDWMIPGIDVPVVSASISQVLCGTQEDSWHMHQFAQREVGNEKAYEEEMDIEDQIDSLWRHGVETKHSHDPFLHLNQINLVDEPHQDPRDGNPANCKKHEVVRGKRNILHLRIDDPPDEEIAQCD